jgi:Nif-specific regulatory protein
MKKNSDAQNNTCQQTSSEIYKHLFEIGKHLLTEVAVDKMLICAMDEAIRISCAERGMIILFDDAKQTLFQTARHLNNEDIENPEFEISRTIIETVKTQKQPICLKNALDDPKFKKSESVEQLQLLSVICLPLLREDALFGVVYLDNRKFSGIFKPETCSFVQEFANFISLAAFQALERKQLQNHVNELEAELRGKHQFDQIIGHHPKMVEILKLISQVSGTDATVLIQGESGTGKELIAQALHYNSHRKDKPFIPINCGAIPEQLLESELFGHVRGAFTGATSDKPGWFERADGGTIFLDEINDMSPALQVRLLRVLQTGEYSRVGSTEIRHCNVRVLAASSRDLQQQIKNGLFREEVYYRLNVIDIHLPPLRERKSDIPLIISQYLNLFGKQYNKPDLIISETARQALLNYDYPGNVRELVNLIQRAVVLAENDLIEIQHLPSAIISSTTEQKATDFLLPFPAAKQNAIENFEKSYIIHNLKETKGNITQAAKRAGIDVKNFYVKMSKYQINPAQYKAN